MNKMQKLLEKKLVYSVVYNEGLGFTEYTVKYPTLKALMATEGKKLVSGGNIYKLGIKIS